MVVGVTNKAPGHTVVVQFLVVVSQQVTSLSPWESEFMFVNPSQNLVQYVLEKMITRGPSPVSPTFFPESLK